ncbi:MAG TPA: Rieske 2Fe-2S domain-containing protein, partial [Caulobacteraceae bacterium]
MAEAQDKPAGPDLTQGVALSSLAEGGMVRGHVGEEPVLLVRQGGALYAVEANCTHYGGPLDEGLLVGDTIRCPWHHACFSLRTGRPVRPPALNDLKCRDVEQRDGKAYVHK